MTFAPRRRELAAPETGVRRVHCIGDSIVYGDGVTIDESMPTQLENALHHEFPDELFACINFGRDGWNIWNSLFHHEALYPNGGCDLIVLSLCNNDTEYLGAYGLTYGTDKLANWEDRFLLCLADRGLAAIKAYSKKFNIPLLVVQYEAYQPQCAPIGDIIGKLCEKHDVLYMDIARAVNERHYLPREVLTVSAADEHPSALFHQLATRIMGGEVRRLGLLQSQRKQDDVVGHISKATQEMLRNECDPQVVFAWAALASATKSIVLPRQIMDRAERQAVRDRLSELAASIDESWCNWQKAVFHEGTIRNIHDFVKCDVQLFLNLEGSVTPLLEFVRLAVWCGEDGKLSELEERTRPLFGKVSAPFFESAVRLRQAQKELAVIRGVIEKRAYEKGGFDWPQPNFLNNNSKNYLIQWIHTVTAMLDVILNDCEILLHRAENSANPAKEFLGYLEGMAEKIVEFLASIIKKITARINLFNKSAPLLAIDAFITVRIGNCSAAQTGILQISAKLESLVPLGTYIFDACHLVDTCLSEATYHIRLPLFAHANLIFYLRQWAAGEDQIEKYAAAITKVELKTAYAGEKMPVDVVKAFAVDAENARRLVLENFWIKV